MSVKKDSQEGQPTSLCKIPKVRTLHTRHLCSDITYVCNSQLAVYWYIGQTASCHDKLFSAIMKNFSKLLANYFVDSRFTNLVTVHMHGMCAVT